MTTGAGPRVPDAQWTTANAPASQQLALWQEAVGRAFVPVSVGTARPHEFISDVSVHRLGGVELSFIAGPAQQVDRTAEHVRAAAGDVFFLNLPVSGAASVRQAGHQAMLRPGDFVVIDSDRPFDLTFDTAFRQISLKLPRDLVHTRLPFVEEMSGVRVAGDQGLGAVAAASIRAAAGTAATLDRQASGALAERLIDLVGLALGGLRQAAHVPSALLFQAALDEADRRLGDPDLTPTVVAARVGVSVRYLHRLFSDNGPTFGRWLLLRRLALARSDLCDPGQRHVRISEIALRRGFGDPSYFTRAFRTQYGTTPRAVRELSSTERLAAPVRS